MDSAFRKIEAGLKDAIAHAGATASYLALIEHDAAAMAWGAVIPDFPGCNAMGATFDEVKANLAEAMREWAGDIVAGGAALPPARTEADLRADPALRFDFNEGTLVVPLVLTEIG